LKMKESFTGLDFDVYYQQVVRWKCLEIQPCSSWNS
jgi:hypothetical protein